MTNFRVLPRILPVLIIAALVLCACGGGGSGNNNQTQTPTYVSITYSAVYQYNSPNLGLTDMAYDHVTAVGIFHSLECPPSAGPGLVLKAGTCVIEAHTP